jgi:phosphate starvation-inducible protein PhoH and related proteins
VARRKTLADKVSSGEERIIKEKFEGERKAPPIQAKNDFQKRVLKALNTKQIVVVKAPAGVGKSYLTMATAADWLVQGKIDKIILTRPAVGMGKTLGLLKGDLDSKFDPFLAPLIEVFTDRYGKGRWETALHAGNVEKVPIEYMRGRNIRDVAIADESQNMTPDEMFALITRVTEDGRLFIIGDPVQTDMKQESGLVWLYSFVEKHNLHEYIEIIEATNDDIVRGGLCKAFVKAMEQDRK